MLRRLCVLLLAVACNHPVRDAKKLIRRPPEGPQIAATVVTIRTTVQPGNQSSTSTIVIGSDLARDAGEIGTWRLFDLKNNRIAFVDDGAKTFRWESIDGLGQRRALQRTAGEPEPQFALTSVRRPILGVTAEQAIVKLGAYQREVWLGSHPLIPANLFALMIASDGAREHAVPGAHGFPLAEHAEVPYGKSKLVVDRQVVSVARKNVPEALLVIPPAYRQLPATAPVARPLVAASRPRDRRTPEAELRSSVTTRTDP